MATASQKAERACIAIRDAVAELDSSEVAKGEPSLARALDEIEEGYKLIWDALQRERKQ